MGLKLKKIFNDFGISEKTLTSSSSTLSVETSYDKKVSYYIFTNTYSTLFKHFDLIDTLRKMCVEAGATDFIVGELKSDKESEYMAKVRSLAYTRAKEKAEAILNDSGSKLGKPLTIVGQQYSPISARSNDNTEGLGYALPLAEHIEPLLQNRQIIFSSEIEVKFQLVE